MTYGNGLRKEEQLDTNNPNQRRLLGPKALKIFHPASSVSEKRHKPVISRKTGISYSSNSQDPIYSDKHYWHRYSNFYRKHLNNLVGVSLILEFGVLNGDSIRWLRRMFSDADIIGIDILPTRPEWPMDSRIRYLQADQGNQTGIQQLLQGIGRTFDLVIEDGSHIPQHQASCLVTTFPMLTPGGLYVLEDLHTSLPSHPYYLKYCADGTPTSLNLLHLIEHLRATGQVLSDAHIKKLSYPGIFSENEIKLLNDRIDTIDIFRRNTLPIKCWSCRSDDFDYLSLRCSCGVNISIEEPDSMTAAIRSRSIS